MSRRSLLLLEQKPNSSQNASCGYANPDLHSSDRRYEKRVGSVSVTQCGINIHPDAPRLGASPDAKVFNPGVTPCGLAELKSFDVENVAQV